MFLLFWMGMTNSQSDDSDDDDYEKVKLDSDTNNHDVNSMESMLDNVGAIPRKNVEDVHSTYRISCSDIDGKGEGQWHRIPTLLLVEGDFIALKVGDTAPAKCRPLS